MTTRWGSSWLPRTSAATYTAAKPDPWTAAAAPYARRARQRTATGYRPDDGSAARRISQAPPKPNASPAATPTTSSHATMPAVPSSPWSSHAPLEIRVTRTTVGASFSPDSDSSVPINRRGSGTTRSTENTAAASVGDVTAPSSTASSQGMPSR